MSMVAGVFRLLSRTVKAATSVVTGIGDLPPAISARIANAHASADQLESERSRAGSTETSAGESIRELISQKMAEGYTVRVISDGDCVVLAFLPPTREREVEAIAAAAIAKAKLIQGEIGEREGDEPEGTA